MVVVVERTGGLRALRAVAEMVVGELRYELMREGGAMRVIERRTLFAPVERF